jgi:valyl-tRNA synthetase
VKFYEKGDQPLEIVPTRQWFVRLVDKKEDLLRFGHGVSWHPPAMRARYDAWVEGLHLDWCISRQRFFGVPFPLWYALDGNANRDIDRPLLADPATLPIDPAVVAPPGREPSERGRPHGFVGETDVFDTWFTSSMTPLISSGWGVDPIRHDRLFPADLRAQSHEIIRTWAFYTIAKAMLHERSVPWKHIAISGWVLDPARAKMAKTRGNATTPSRVIDLYGADAVRYWASCARLGTDTAYDEKMFRVGKRLVTKLFHAGRFVLSHEHVGAPITHELDRAFVRELATVIADSSAAFERFDHSRAMACTESFFWKRFTDSYLELSKARARGESSTGETGRGSAVSALRLGFDVLLRLFAPFLPFITEELWSHGLDQHGDERRSIHRSRWPQADELAATASPQDEASLARAITALTAINKRKSELGASTGRMLARLVLAAHPATLTRFESVREDVVAAARARTQDVVPRANLPEETFEVSECEMATGR